MTTTGFFSGFFDFSGACTGAVVGPVTVLRRVFAGIAIWRERATQRRHLATLSDRMLRDIGVDRAHARVEASKPFWRP